jgi:hypothetical protein
MSDDRTYDVLEAILSGIPRGTFVRGDFYRQFTEVLMEEENPLVTENISFDRRYGISEDIIDTIMSWKLGGLVSG